MKNISSRLIGALISVHLVLAYIAGLSIQPFEFMPKYIWIMIPVIALLVIAFSRLDPIFKNYKYHSLGTKMSLTAKTPWVWALLLITTLLVVGIMWYGGQSLLPKTEISQRITFDGNARTGIIIGFVICFGLYIACMIWLYKTLKLIWKR